MSTSEASTLDVTAYLIHTDWISGLALNLVRDRDVAEEIVQETMLTSVSTPPTHSTYLKAWFASVLRSKAIRHSKSESSREDREKKAGAEAPSVAEAAADLVVKAETQRRVIDAVLALDEEMRSVILMRYYGDQNSTQIAEEIGSTPTAVRSRIKRGIERLRAQLDDDFPEWKAPCLVLAGLTPFELQKLVRPALPAAPVIAKVAAATMVGAASVAGFMVLGPGESQDEALAGTTVVTVGGLAGIESPQPAPMTPNAPQPAPPPQTQFLEAGFAANTLDAPGVDDEFGFHEYPINFFAPDGTPLEEAMQDEEWFSMHRMSVMTTSPEGEDTPLSQDDFEWRPTRTLSEAEVSEGSLPDYAAILRVSADQVEIYMSPALGVQRLGEPIQKELEGSSVSLTVSPALILQAAATVRGRAVSATDASPIPNATVEFDYGDSHASDIATTDAEGYFERKIAPGTVNLLIHSGSQSYKDRLSFSSGSLDLGDLPLSGPSRVEVHVVDENGNPVAGLMGASLSTALTLSPSFQLGTNLPWGAISDELGLMSPAILDGQPTTLIPNLPSGLALTSIPLDSSAASNGPTTLVVRNAQTVRVKPQWPASVRRLIQVYRIDGGYEHVVFAAWTKGGTHRELPLEPGETYRFRATDGEAVLSEEVAVVEGHNLRVQLTDGE